MKSLFFLLLFCSFLSVNCQTRYDPFRGGLEIGYGISTAVNLKTRPAVGNIFDMPFSVGFITMKYLNNLQSVEIGFSYGRHTADYKKLQLNDYSYPLISLNCIDFPLRFFFIGSNEGKKLKRIFCGVTTSYLIQANTYSNSGPHILDRSYRKVYCSLSAGLSIEGRKSRFKIHPNFAITSIIKPEIELDTPCKFESCGGRLYPLELMFSYNYLFN